MQTLDREAFEFFHRAASYVVGERALGAATLARAEQWGDDLDIELALEPDWDPDLSWMDEEERARDHECYDAFLSYDGKLLPFSVGGVVDPDADFLRLLRAELLTEAMDLPVLLVRAPGSSREIEVVRLEAIRATPMVLRLPAEAGEFILEGGDHGALHSLIVPARTCAAASRRTSALSSAQVRMWSGTRVQPLAFMASGLTG